MSGNIRIHRALSLIGGGTPVRILIDGRSFGTIMTGGTADYPVSEGPMSSGWNTAALSPAWRNWSP